MNRMLYKVLAIAGGILIIIYISVQMFRGSFSSVKTEVAVKTTAYETVSAKGFVVRDEKAVNSTGTGVLEYEAQNGSKISKNGVIAEYYSDEKAVENNKKLDALENKISNLTELNSQNNIYVPDLDMIGSQINQTVSEILADIESGNVSKIKPKKTLLLNYFNQNKLATKQISNFDSEIADCKAEWNQLKSMAKDSNQKVLSNTSGYFVNRIDGYESVINFNDVLKLTPKKIESLKPNMISKNSIGKIVSEHEWYIAAVLKTEDTKNIKEEKDLTLKIPLSTIDELPVKVEKINEEKGTGKTVVIFSCSYMNEELSEIRMGEIEIIIRKHVGLEINNSAVRLLNGERGVYANVANMAKFRKINVLYSGDKTSICEIVDMPGYIAMYDDVIVEGKDLYDKKFIK